MRRLILMTAAVLLSATAPAQAGEPTLEARAILPADATWPAPFPGIPNTEPAPAPGSTQPIGGFSALLDAGHGSVWAMPDNGFGRTPNLAGSNGFEAMALSKDGRTLYPILEGPLAGADPLDRVVFEFDVRQRRFTGRRWTYEMSRAGTLVSDATALGRDRLIVLERDNNQGPAAEWKRAFTIPVPGRHRTLEKRQVVDLLDIRDPHRISLPGRSGDFGLGDPFAFPYVTVESVLPVGGDELAIVNDTNFGSTGRNAALPDYSDFIVVEVPALDR